MVDFGDTRRYLKVSGIKEISKMGFQDFMDAVLGRSRLPKAKSDKLFEISTACITLESSLSLKPSGYAGICFKPIGTSAYESTRKEIQELLEYSSKDKRDKVQN
jgi:hypothetical protein